MDNVEFVYVSRKDTVCCRIEIKINGIVVAKIFGNDADIIKLYCENNEIKLKESEE